jgi:hypothetical protein
MNSGNTTSASEMGGTADESAAEAYEEDFFWLKSLSVTYSYSCLYWNFKICDDTIW